MQDISTESLKTLIHNFVLMNGITEKGILDCVFHVVDRAEMNAIIENLIQLAKVNDVEEFKCTH